MARFAEMFYRYDTFKYITPIEIGVENCSPKHSFASVRQFWLLHYIVSGNGVYNNNGKRYELSAGQMFIIHPGEFSMYVADEDDPWEYIWIGFTADVKMPALLTDNYYLDAAEYSLVFEKAAASVRDGSIDGAGAYGLIWELIGRLTENSVTDTNNNSQKMALAEKFIDMHISDNISVTEIADMLHIDRSYFYVLFKQHTGMSPKQYICHVKTARAKTYLQGGMKASNVASACGYPDIYTFSKHFKRECGMSPTEYIKSSHTNHDKDI